VKKIASYLRIAASATRNNLKPTPRQESCLTLFYCGLITSQYCLGDAGSVVEYNVNTVIFALEWVITGLL
jgi:hypothetical protein